jgi:hypothetical protein
VVREAELWPPLAPLGAAAAPLERALGGAPVHQVEALIPQPADARAAAAVAAARFALALRIGDRAAEIDALGMAAQRAFLAAEAPREAAFVQVERAAALLSDKTRLPEAAHLLDTLPSSADDRALDAAAARVRGAIARARADLRGSLLHLERARELAEASGHPREILRTLNTLGTSYAALGVASLAREALERARELAELAGQRQSAAIAAGQLATLALDAGNPALAARHLQLQRSVSEQLGDLHGQARALSLLVEAHGEAHQLALAALAASEARALHAAAPSPWTRLQAALASLYEAELALAGGDLERAAELLASCHEERTSDAPPFRILRARSSLALLWQALRDPPPLPLDAFLSSALAPLMGSPRPMWVEKAMKLSLELAKQAGRTELIPLLAQRLGSLIELRAAASSGALVVLRASAPEAAIGRAMALGRELILRARLALGPIGEFHTSWVEVEVAEEGAIDAALAAFEAPGRPGELPPGLLAWTDGYRQLRVAAAPEQVAPGLARLEGQGGLRGLRQGEGAVRVEASAQGQLWLRRGSS